MMIGYIDSVSRRKIKGWAHYPGDSYTPVILLCLCNGELIDRLVANSYRPDLEQAGIGSGYHGFELEWSLALDPTRRHTISLIEEGSGAEIKNSPYVLEAEDSFSEETKTGLTSLLRAIEDRDGLMQAARFLLEQAEQLGLRVAEIDSFCREDAQPGTAGPGDAEPGASQPAPILPFAGYRALVLDEVLPANGRDAGSNAILSHIASLERLGFEVSFAAVHYDAQPQAALSVFAGTGVRPYTPPLFHSVEEVLRRNVGQFDFVYIHRTSMAVRYVPLIRYWHPYAVVAYLVADLHSLRMSRQAGTQDDTALLDEALRLQKAELAAAWQVDTVITHSYAERDILRLRLPALNVHVIPWDVGLQPTDRSFNWRRGVAFIGNYKHAPNRDAAEHLLNEIMPRVWKLDPGIECWLYGTGLPKHLQSVLDGRLHFVGAVPDIREVFRNVRLTVAPLRFGAGLKGKVLDSFGAGIPCVCSPVAAEGMDLPSALADLLAGDADDFARTIVTLHNDAAQYQTMAAHCMAYVESRCSTRQIDDLMKTMVLSAGLTENEPEPAALYPIDETVHPRFASVAE